MAITAIDGQTRLIAHIGYPTESFKAPLIYNPYFAKIQSNTIVVPMACKTTDYPVFLRAVFTLSNICGALITMPHKISTTTLVDDLSPAASIAGACNAVKLSSEGRLQGSMFDGEGFVRGIVRKGFTVAGSRALIVGCGGVGSAIAASLAGAGINELRLSDTNVVSATGLAERLIGHYPGVAVRQTDNDPAECDLIVNATPLGMRINDPLPVAIERIPQQALVGEVVMTHTMTPFLQAVEKRGIRYQVGTDMLYEMIPAYLEYFDLPVTTPERLREVSLIP